MNRGTLLELSRDMLISLSHQADENSVEVGFGMPYAVFYEIRIISFRKATKHEEKIYFDAVRY